MDKEQLTKLPDGSRPSYEDLEESFLNTYFMLSQARQEVKRLTEVNAELRYHIKKGK